MQTLVFEPAWNKTISQKDRLFMEEAFQHCHVPKQQGIQITPLWRAVNHKEDLLITSFVHNFTDHEFQMDERKLSFMDNHIEAEHRFLIHALKVAAHTTMPWTFIFPKGTYVVKGAFQRARTDIQNGSLIFS